MTEPRRFPAGFLWGNATAAHQVEGGNTNNDWYAFEQQPGHIANGDVSGIADDNFHRYREDFKTLRKLANNAHRLSIEWSRIEPTPGEFDARQLRHYRNVLSELREQGMSPMLTLHHFTSPLWFTARGGWAAPGSDEAFLPFVGRVVDELGELVDLWCTINEPNIYATQGWIFGAFPPARRNDVRGAWRVLANLRKAHEGAYRLIKQRRPDAVVGIAHNKFWLLPARPRSVLDRGAVQAGRTLLDWWPMAGRRMQRTVAASADFIGLNHYSGRLLRFNPIRREFGTQLNPPGYPISDFGDAIKPDWIREALVELKRFGKPVYVTESGIATTDDSIRERFLVDILAEVHRAIAEDGVDVRGYFHWTSMDNFEWSHGYRMKFGIIAVDRKTMERTLKPSAHLFGRIARANALPEPH
ncbi:MAG TPA: glycoside hydrolase family 1 protein [Candidatus Dormibacteraeota bacterium]|nr:glycoside hydrolase family 1 protein [Candidatus Dormibacteraeota bacterium]